jgi:M6 family metalloprotease-like protein
MLFNLRRVTLLVTLMAVGSADGAAGQDVELLGRIHGTRPPQGYFDLLERDPGAFQFKRALFRRGLGVRDLPPIEAPGQSVPGRFGGEFAQLLREQPGRTPVTGTFNFPLILGLYSDSPPVSPAFFRDAVQAEFFDGPQANPQATGTIPEFYDETSLGRVTLTGTTFPWMATGLSRFEVTAGVSGLGAGSKVGEYIVRTLQALDDGTVDWGHFDNDGPDGIPNSGDDDGFVDVLAVMHPTPGGECSSSERPNRIWSHRWNLYWNARYYGTAWEQSVQQSIIANVGYVTQTPSASPEEPFIKILDYTIQPVQACNGSDINYIGVFAHELGHGFGLPDLYVTSGSQDHEGIGNWGLMGTGSWGCDGGTAWSPCHMSPWSREVLGWANITTLNPGMDLGTLRLEPAATTGEMFRIDSGDGSEEYLLLENRQRLGFDEYLFEPGLLIWHIDPVTIGNSPGGINNDPDRMGVWLRQGDGLNELAMPNGGRGDDGDPFPGSSGNTEFHAGTTPSSWAHDGGAMGVTIRNIRQEGQDMVFDAMTSFQTLTLRSETVQGTGGLISVDGYTEFETEWDFSSAPFQTHVIEAAAGEPASEGVRWGFEGWTDEAPRVREFTTELEDATLTARYGGREFLVDVDAVSPAQGIVPGFIEFLGGDDGGWVPDGESVLVTATPRTGFQFLQWVGDLAGNANPASITPTGPVTTDAMFGVTFSAQSNPPAIDLLGGLGHTVSLTVENANAPVAWTLISGTLPEQMTLNPSGTIFGTPLRGGEFPMTLRVRDAIGLETFLPLTLVVGDPALPVDALASAFLHSGPFLDADTRKYLDNEGNQNNAYDLGDLRAYVLRNPGLQGMSDLSAVIQMTVPMGDIKNPPGGGTIRREDRP